MLPRRVVLIGLPVGLVLAACLSVSTSPSNASSPEPPYIGPRSPCSTGPAYSDDTTFPEGPAESGQPECVPRCGTPAQIRWGAGGPSPGFDSVPSGQCEYENEACSMVAVRPCCPALPDNGTAFVFECRCRAGVWSCVAAYHGGGTCAGCSEAGAVDGGESGDGG
jgi:hypothetical protein